jgi:hypothetical protein
LAAGVGLAMLFIIYGARVQEAVEKLTVDDFNRTYLVHLP